MRLDDFAEGLLYIFNKGGCDSVKKCLEVRSDVYPAGYVSISRREKATKWPVVPKVMSVNADPFLKLRSLMSSEDFSAIEERYVMLSLDRAELLVQGRTKLWQFPNGVVVPI